MVNWLIAKVYQSQKGVPHKGGMQFLPQPASLAGVCTIIMNEPIDERIRPHVESALKFIDSFKDDPTSSMWKHWIDMRFAFKDMMKKEGLTDAEIEEAIRIIRRHWPTSSVSLDRQFIETLPADSPLLLWYNSPDIEYDYNTHRYKPTKRISYEEYDSLLRFQKALDEYSVKVKAEYTRRKELQKKATENLHLNLNLSTDSDT